MRSPILLCATSLLAVATPALAQSASSQSAPSQSAPDEGANITVIGKAQVLAPSSMPLNVTQPTSVIQSDFIANNIVPLASVDDIIKFQPSVWTQNPNGPGIGKAETMAIRGFQDGQYNVTFDGIPFGDSSDLHHTTGSLFIAHALQQAQIDRGPGTASTIGKATFGGTIGFDSKDPLKAFDLDVYGTGGSFNTFAGGARVDSGQLGPLRLFAEGQHEKTDGYLTHSNERRDNFIGKGILDLGPTTTITALASWNHEFQYTTQGATLAEYAKYGNNYGLCSNESAMCGYLNQPSNYYTDFEYVQLKTQLGPLQIDDQVYHNGFIHAYTESSDATDDNPADNGVTIYSATKIGSKVGTFPNDIKGKVTNARVSTWGNTLRFLVPGKIADLKFGVWADFQHDDRSSYTNDLSQNGALVIGKTGTAYSYIFSDMGTTWQPYAEVDLKPIDGLTINPGVKYTSYARRMDADLNKSTLVPLDVSATYKAWQPSVAANYMITPQWSVYAQSARGFLAPPVDVFQINSDQIGPLKPETTWNWQAGTVIHGHNWSLSLDGYYINFSNYLSAQNVIVNGSQESTYVNGGGAIYKGLESEGQYVLARGLSLYANATLNSAKYKNTTITLEEAPKWTAAGGLLFEDKHGPFASLIGKAIGPRFGDDSGGLAPGDVASSHIGTTFTADLAAGWHIDHVGQTLHGVTVSFKMGNLFNSHALTDYAGTQSATNLPLYWRAAGRSVFFNLEAHV